MSFVVAVIVGVVVAAPVLALMAYISRERALDLLAVQLAAIAAVYAGSSLAEGGIPVFAAEMIGVVAFIVVALFGRWGSPAILAAGYSAHGAWDAIHHLGVISTFLPDWYAPFCLGYDGIVGGLRGCDVLATGMISVS
jgi:hypothetical protein